MDTTRRDEIKELARRVLVEPETIWPERMTAYLMAQAMCHSSEELDLLCKEVERLQLVLENQRRGPRRCRRRRSDETLGPRSSMRRR
jgi:hypothetical protein